MYHKDMLFSMAPNLKEPSAEVCRLCDLQQSNMVLVTKGSYRLQLYFLFSIMFLANIFFQCLCFHLNTI